jgi:predicted PurR-regulated permease PerM
MEPALRAGRSVSANPFIHHPAELGRRVRVHRSMDTPRSTRRIAARSVLPLGRFAGYVAVALGIACVFLLAWGLREILLLTFGAILLAAIIRTVAGPIITRFPTHDKIAIGGAILGLLLVLGGLFWLFGHQISEQMRGLTERLPTAMTAGKSRMEQSSVGRFVLENMPGAGDSSGMMNGVKKAAFVTFDSLGHTLLMAVAGIYLALTPRPYLDGTIRLFPPAHRSKVRDALVAAGTRLQRWLLGQLISMAAIGTLTTLGLWIVGCPVPVALGILAGLFAFVPVIGFLLAFVPTILIALSEGGQVALAATLVFLVVQQLEEQLVLPMAQKWATALPPALGLLSLAAAGALFGLPGLIFGCPLTVVIMCLVQKLYIENGIERRTA